MKNIKFKLSVFLCIFFFTINSSADDVFKCTIDGILKFSDKPCGNKIEKTKYINPKYITLKYGGSACSKRTYWEKAIDLHLGDLTEEGNNFTKQLARNCYYLKENNTVYGFLDSTKYKNNELVKIKTSDGKLLWLELAGILPIINKSSRKPYPWYTNISKPDVSFGFQKRRVTKNKFIPKNKLTTTVGTRTKGGGIACLSESWYLDVISNTNIEIYNNYLRSKKCLILKKNMPITLLDTTIFTRRTIFSFKGIKFWTSQDNIIMD